MTKDEVLKLISQVKWHQSFEVFPGIITPGIWKPNPKFVLPRCGVGSQLTGKRVLDIGTFDGAYAFELESRGADVIAADIQDPDNTGFNIARKILNSKVKYVKTSVYDLKKNLDGNFDIILFLGVYYHLKYPVLAFEQIHEVLEDDGLLIFEGEFFSHYAETLDSMKIRNRYRLLLSLIAHSDIPVTLFYSGTYKNDSSSWHIPNPACLKSWLKAACFQVIMLETYFGECTQTPASQGKLRLLKKIIRAILHFNEYQRLIGTAVKMPDKSVIEHALVTTK